MLIRCSTEGNLLTEAVDAFFLSVFTRKISGRQMANILSSKVKGVKYQPEKAKEQMNKYYINQLF